MSFIPFLVPLPNPGLHLHSPKVLQKLPNWDTKLQSFQLDSRNLHQPWTTSGLLSYALECLEQKMKVCERGTYAPFLY